MLEKFEEAKRRFQTIRHLSSSTGAPVNVVDAVTTRKMFPAHSKRDQARPG